MDTKNSQKTYLIPAEHKFFLDSQAQLNITSLLEWSSEHFHELPWRKNRSLYTTLISEFMLQQTTVSAVVPKFLKFISKYPTWESFHIITEEDMLALWAGLGYYSRARALLKIARMFKDESEFFTQLHSDKKIIGIGPYTKGALLSIGLDQPQAALDANINRILKRYHPSEYLAFYHQILTFYSPRAINEALMDLGREICQSRKASCEKCFLSSRCKSAFQIDTQIISKHKIKETKVLLKIHRFVLKKSNLFAAIRKKKGQWLEGYLEVPSLIEGAPYQEARRIEQYPQLAPEALDFLKTRFITMKKNQQSITKYRIENYIWTLDETEKEEWDYLLGLFDETDVELEWHPKESLWAAPSLKILKDLSE